MVGMVDQLITVDSDNGPVEPEPVTLVFGGNAVDLSSLSATRLTARIVSSAASTNATLIKSSPGYGFGIMGYNNNAAARYLKLYNKATAPVVGTDIPILTFYIEPSDSFAFDLSGVRFTAGIGLAITTGSPDADTTAIGGGDIMGLNMVYA